MIMLNIKGNILEHKYCIILHDILQSWVKHIWSERDLSQITDTRCRVGG